MTLEVILFLILGGFAGGFVNGFAGTGTALFSLGFLLRVLEPATAVAVVVLMAVISGIQGLWVVRANIFGQKTRVIRFVIPGLIGVPLGVYSLQFIDDSALRLLVAALLVTYGAFFGFRTVLPRFQRRTPRADVGVALVSGYLGGLAGLSGALPTIWVTMRGWSKGDTRAVLQCFNFVILLVTIAGLVVAGAYTRDAFVALAIAVTAGLVGVQLGIFLFRRMSDDTFRRTLILLCLVMGVGMFADVLMSRV